MVEDSSIPALRFGSVKCLVGCGEKRLRAFTPGRWIENGRTHAACDSDLGLSRVDLQVGDRGMKTGQPLFGAPVGNLGQNQKKFVSAVAAGMVIDANRGANRCGEPAQRFIPSLIPAGIVDTLEVVQVYQCQQQRAAFAAGTVNLRAQFTKDSHSIQHSGQDVVSQLDAQLLAADLQFAGARFKQVFQLPALPL